MRERSSAWPLKQIGGGVIGFALGLLGNVVSSAIPLPVLLVIALLLALVGWWASSLESKPIQVVIRSVRPLRDAPEKERHARRGLIASVSLYTGPGRERPAEELANILARKDYNAFDFARSNLATTIEAIKSHAHKLEHCWLIGTTSHAPQFPGSSAYIPTLVAYLQNECKTNCQFHYGDRFDVSLDDDALVFERTHEVMGIIFDEASALGLKPRDLIADFTAGMRSLSLGMILSCLDRERDIEMIGTRYGVQGKPEGPLFPMVFSFEPERTSD